MEHSPTYDPEMISPKFLDIQKILAAKNVKLHKLLIGFMERILHLDEINSGIYRYRYKVGLDFVQAILGNNHPDDLDIQVTVVNAHHLSPDGHPIIAGNHPLGGPDGLALMGAIGQYRTDIKFPVNDFLLHLPQLAPLFIPIDKVHRNTRAINSLENAFAAENAMLYFPAGLCSRKQKNGQIHDLEWKPTFVKKAVQHQRDIIPFYFDARNRKRFYNIARLRVLLGFKFNFEMALLPGELFAQRGKKLRLVIGQPIPYQTFDSRHTPREWAQLLQDHCYRLNEDPNAKFNY